MKPFWKRLLEGQASGRGPWDRPTSWRYLPKVRLDFDASMFSFEKLTELRRQLFREATDLGRFSRALVAS